MSLLAVLIAAALTFVALLPLVRPHFRQPTFWALVAVGVFSFPIAQWVNRTVWDPLAAQLGVPEAGLGLVLGLFVWALLTEGFKFAPVTIVGLMTGAAPRDWYAYGAAAAAGFSFFAAQQVIGFALEVSRLPLSTTGSTALAILLRFFPILGHIATTTFVAWATPRGGLIRALLLATAVQTLLGLVEREQAAAGPLLGNVLFALITLFLFLYVWTLRDRPLAGPSRQLAG